MRWLIGVDLSPNSRGALQFARWLHRTAVDDAQAFEAAYVLPPPAGPHSSPSELQHWTTQAQEALARAIADADAGPAVRRTQVLPPGDADDALAELAAQRDVDVLVVGRQARRDQTRLVRLGRVARRLVRRLPTPVAVVPPDLELAAIGDGPILLATSLATDSDGAATLARALSQSQGRRLLVAHIVPTVHDGSPHFVPTITRERLMAQVEEDGRRALQVWMGQHAMRDCDAIVASGSTVDRLVDLARAERCPLIVCGSRELGLAPRFFVSSVGTDLAAGAACPVVVVPPLPAPG